jgi:hypothetical protein
MNATELITLKAFFIALALQPKPLPAELLTQLKAISHDMSSNLGKLDNLGDTYLGDLYLEISDSLHDQTADIPKGLPAEIDEVEERLKAEIQNLVEVIDRMNGDKGKQPDKSTLNDVDTWKAVQQIVAAAGYPVL